MSSISLVARQTFQIVEISGKLLLIGDLDSSPIVLRECRHALENIRKFSYLVIEAHDLQIVPEGVTVWIEAVNEFLMGCELTYAASQLAVVLAYDDRYTHPKSTFRE